MHRHLNGLKTAALLGLLTSLILAAGYWLGGSDSAKEGSWVWLDGTGFHGDGAAMGSYKNFRSGEPSDGAIVGEDCLVLTATGEWNDSFCGSLNRFICEAP